MRVCALAYVILCEDQNLVAQLSSGDEKVVFRTLPVYFGFRVKVRVRVKVKYLVLKGVRN